MTARTLEPEITWQAHPARQRPRAAALGVALIAGLAAAVYATAGGLGWSLLATALLLAALNRFFFRSRFEIDAEGITARYPFRTRRCLWRNIRRFVVDDDGGWLSTRARRTRLDAYSGLHVLFGRDRDGVIARIRDHLPQESRP